MNNLKNSIYSYIEMNQEIRMDCAFTQEKLVFNKEIASRIREQDLKKQVDVEAFKKRIASRYMTGNAPEQAFICTKYGKITGTVPGLLKLRRNAYAR